MAKRERGDKRAFVEQVRALMAERPEFSERHWFTVATKLFDVDADEARLTLDAAVLDEHAPTLRVWRKNVDAQVREILSAPVREDDA